MENNAFDQIIEEIGLATRWEARGEARKAKEFAQYLIKKGWAREEIAEATQLDLLTVESLMGTAHA